MNNTGIEKNVQDDKTKDVLRVVDSLVIDVLHVTLRYARNISSVPLLQSKIDSFRKDAKHRIKSILSEE